MQLLAFMLLKDTVLPLEIISQIRPYDKPSPQGTQALVVVYVYQGRHIPAMNRNWLKRIRGESQGSTFEKNWGSRIEITKTMLLIILYNQDLKKQNDLF